MKSIELIQTVAHSILRDAAASAAYETWTDAYARDKIRDAWNNTPRAWRATIEGHLTVDQLREISDETLRMFGFGIWEDNHWVIPLYLYNFIANGEELIAIDGEKAIKGKDEIDLDIRFGCIAYGFIK